MVLGDHKKCDQFYCNQERMDKFKALEISEEAKNALKHYLFYYSERAHKLKNVTSNIVECFFSINNKF